MNEARKAAEWIRENATAEDAEKLGKAVDLIEDRLPNLPDGSVGFASVHLYMTEDGKVGFVYAKDQRIQDRTLVVSLLETAESILSKEDRRNAA